MISDVYDLNGSLGGLALGVVAPEIFLSVAAMAILVIGVIWKRQETGFVSWLCVGAIVLCAAIILSGGYGVDETGAHRQTALYGAFINDEYAQFLKILILIGLAASIIIAQPALEIRGINHFEYPLLIVLSGIGMLVMVSSNHFLTFYMGLELQSLALYVLAAFQRGNVKSSEAGLKYFILGALASGILLFGISMIYGFTGTLSFPLLLETIGTGEMSAGLIVGLVLVLIAVAFKISAVPFHMWTPDVYEGAPTPVTALFVIVPKIAAIGLLMRFLFDAFGGAVFEWSQILIILSVASMVWGAFAALTQNNIKRLMAYSSIGNMGYALMGLAPGTESGVSAVLLYLAIYMVMTAGVFACILRLQRNDIEVKTIPEMAGLVRTNPFTAYLIAIFMFSMSGLPPLAGFFGKLAVFQAALEAEFYILAVIGVLTSVVAAYYYLRIIKVMLFDDGAEPLDKETALPRRFVAGFAALFAVLFILKPDMLYVLTDGAARSLFGG